ncbi:MAG: esterase [Planctomycetota bacterium]
MSRLLSILFIGALIGCSGRSESNSSTMQNERPWGGLKVQQVGIPIEQANQVVVLLHGYGASGSDLVPLADGLQGDKRTFVFPAGPIPLDSGGVAWATSEDEVRSSEQALIGLVQHIQKMRPEAEIAVGGFSQGATMSSLLTDKGLPIKHLLLFSPGLLVESFSAASGKGPKVMIAHGTDDDVLAYSDAEKLKELLISAGYVVNWKPFEGGHSILIETLNEAKAQLDEASQDP